MEILIYATIESKVGACYNNLASASITGITFMQREYVNTC
jgi:hypothetical protein